MQTLAPSIVDQYSYGSYSFLCLWLCGFSFYLGSTEFLSPYAVISHSRRGKKFDLGGYVSTNSRSPPVGNLSSYLTGA